MAGHLKHWREGGSLGKSCAVEKQQPCYLYVWERRQQLEEGGLLREGSDQMLLHKKLFFFFFFLRAFFPQSRPDVVLYITTRQRVTAAKAVGWARPPQRGQGHASPSGTSSGAPGSGGMVQTPSTELATARCKATDRTPHQRRAHPCVADALNGAGARRALRRRS